MFGLLPHLGTLLIGHFCFEYLVGRELTTSVDETSSSTVVEIL